MSVAANIALRNFDRPPVVGGVGGGWLSLSEMRRQARRLVASYRVKTPSIETPIENLSGGNVQRTMLARELSGDVGILFRHQSVRRVGLRVCRGHSLQIVGQRNRGAAVLLISEDLDEILELATGLRWMSSGRITYIGQDRRYRPEHDRPTYGRPHPVSDAF